MIAFNLPPVTIEIIEGDIAAQSTDAVVNAANSALWMGSGVAGAIKARGGQEIEAEAMAQGPVKVGESVLTTGGRLPAKHVIHAAVMGQDLETSADLIAAATRSALGLADAHGLTSVALPAFGTGVGGFPLDTCARIMMTTLQATAPTVQSLRLVRLVLFGREAYETFARTGREIFDRARPTS